MGRAQDVVFWLLLGQGVALLLLDTYVRRLPGESYWHAVVFINQREMRRGVWGSAMLSLVLGGEVLHHSAWWGLLGVLPIPVAGWWLFSQRSPDNRSAARAQQFWPGSATKPSSHVRRLPDARPAPAETKVALAQLWVPHPWSNAANRVNVGPFCVHGWFGRTGQSGSTRQ
jgi:hypothetical protein